MVAAWEGELIQAWFCSSAGGQTATAAEGLNYTGEDVPYILSLPSKESDKAPEDTRSWTATFTWEEIAAAAGQMGVSLGAPDSLIAVEWGPSGRVTLLEAEGKTLNAAEMRIALGSDAGAYRVLHGQGTLDEYALLKRALGHGTDALLADGEAFVRERFRPR